MAQHISVELLGFHEIAFLQLDLKTMQIADVLGQSAFLHDIHAELALLPLIDAVDSMYFIEYLRGSVDLLESLDD